MASRRRALAAVAGFGVLLAAIALAGRSVGLPRAGSWGEASAWYDEVGPARAVIGGACVMAFVVAGWLLAASLLQLFAVCAPTRGLRAMADLISPRSLQRLVCGLAGVSLTASLTVVAPSAGFTGDSGGEVAVLRRVPGEPPDAGSATLRLAPPVEAPSPQPVPVPVMVASVTVGPGDSLWSLAEEALVDAGDPHPSEAGVALYWRRLIRENRRVLVVPDNP
ncbi:MAG: hypothetical protein ACT452_14610, partial [Microthrixaceae bacterium]